MRSAQSPRRARPNPTAALLATAAALAACGDAAQYGVGPRAARVTHTPFRPIASPFPTAGAVEQIAAQPPPAPATEAPRVEVVDWTLEGPLPAATGAQAPEATEASPFDALLREAVARHPGARVTTGMDCAAHEVGRFVLARGGLPATGLQDFIFVRCGAGVVQGAVAVLQNALPRRVSDADVVARERAQVASEIESGLAAVPGSGLAGVWYGRDDANVVVALAFAQQRVEFDPAVAMTPSAPGGTVTVRGRALEPASRVEPWVTLGAHRAVPCALDPSVAPPAFSASCPTRADDALAYIDVSVVPPGALLGQNAGSVLVFPGGTPTNAYVRPAGEATTTAPSAAPGATPAQRIVDAVNVLRVRESMPPLALEADQSATACRLAPHILGELEGNGPVDLGNLAALGLIAGWQVHGPVREGWFGGMVLGASGEPGAWLGAAMQHPLARVALMEPSASRVALCARPRENPQEGQGVVWATYALVDPTAAAAQARDVLARLAARRAARRLAPADVVPELAQAAARVARGLEARRIGPDQLLDTLLDQARVATGGRAVRGYVVQSLRIESVELPDALATAASPHLGLAVAWWRGPGMPWALPLVLVVALAPDAPPPTV